MLTPNHAFIEQELTWFSQVLEARLSSHFSGQSWSLTDLPPPSPHANDGPYANLLQQLGLSAAERLTLILALIPIVRPQILDALLIKNSALDRPFTEFGGRPGRTGPKFLPSCETALFLGAGNNLGERLAMQALFDKTHVFTREGILLIDPSPNLEQILGQRLRLSASYQRQLTSGDCRKPEFSIHFPGTPLTTQASWADICLAPEIMSEIGNLQTWLKHSASIHPDGAGPFASPPAYRVIFAGPPGTGKKTVAALLGVSAGLDVYRVDLPLLLGREFKDIVQNLDHLFDQATRYDWLLFFNESDLLLAEGLPANQFQHDPGLAYLKQKLAQFPGLIIFACEQIGSNKFVRQCQAAIHFALPDAKLRLQLWQRLLPPERQETALDLPALADEHALSAPAITNAILNATLLALSRNSQRIAEGELLASIKRAESLNSMAGSSI